LALNRREQGFETNGPGADGAWVSALGKGMIGKNNQNFFTESEIRVQKMN
jgi:hypothetical protein